MQAAILACVAINAQHSNDVCSDAHTRKARCLQDTHNKCEWCVCVDLPPVCLTSQTAKSLPNSSGYTCSRNTSAVEDVAMDPAEAAKLVSCDARYALLLRPTIAFVFARSIAGGRPHHNRPRGFSVCQHIMLKVLRTDHKAPACSCAGCELMHVATSHALCSVCYPLGASPYLQRHKPVTLTN